MWNVLRNIWQLMQFAEGTNTPLKSYIHISIILIDSIFDCQTMNSTTLKKTIY